jgi:small neutral amino acid transporter SnatA (MarC family)
VIVVISITGEGLAMSLFSAAALLFFVMDPLGNVPLFLSALRHVDPARVAPSSCASC